MPFGWLWGGARAVADASCAVLQGSGLGAAPEATQERLDAIREKLEERRRILALPQRFAGSKQLSRREMEIEQALFQGTDRHSFLRALYHQGAAPTQGSSCTHSQPVCQPHSVLSLRMWFCFGAGWEEIFPSLMGAGRVGSLLREVRGF